MGELAEGTRLAHFRIVAKLGEGGMGVVYRAEDLNLKRVVALKVLPEASAHDEEGRRRLLREARSAAAVQHHNIAVVYDVGEADGRVYVAMELVEGRTLRRVLARGALPLREALRIGRSVASALARAHERGIVHRDLKPDNVMLGPEGEVKVLDFGLAKARASAPGAADPATSDTMEVVTQQGLAVGTPGYMAPEQAAGREADPRADVFSFGVFLYELLAGQLPFKGDSALALIIASTRDPYVPLSKLDPRVSPALDAVVARCLAKTPADRYPGGRELSAALASLELGAADTVAAAATASPPRRRSRAPTVALVALAGAALVAAAVLLPRLRHRAEVVPDAAPGAGGAASIVITDHPSPRTTSKAAADAYVAGLQSFRDASIAAGIASFRHALDEDPAFAAAAVELVIHDFPLSLKQLRAWVAMAVAQRASLLPRDALLLEAAQAQYTLDQPDRAADARRWSELADRFPTDAEIALEAGERLSEAGDVEGARLRFDHALALDPAFAWVESERARMEFVNGNLDAALAGDSHCLEISPSAATCLRGRLAVDALRGNCKRIADDARHMIGLEPDGYPGYKWLGAALVSVGSSPEAAADAYRSAAARSRDPDTRTGLELDARTIGGLVAGDLASVLAILKEADAKNSGATLESDVGDLVRMEMALLDEMGDDVRLLALVDAYARRLPALVPDRPVARGEMLGIRRRAHHLSDSEMRSTRDAWMHATGPHWTRGDEWLEYYAGAARTPDEAREALAALPQWSPLGPEGRVRDEEKIGRVYLLAGKPDEAIVHLRLAAQNCILDSWEVLPRVQARGELAEAQAAAGDVAGACESSRAVLERWGNAKPRSVTADRARQRMKALACAQAP